MSKRHTFPDGSQRRWYHDPDFEYIHSLRFSLTVLFVVLGAFAIVGAIGVGALFVDKSGCEQKAVSRPDIRVEWHWNTGCILLTPETTVVVSG